MADGMLHPIQSYISKANYSCKGLSVSPDTKAIENTVESDLQYKPYFHFFGM